MPPERTAEPDVILDVVFEEGLLFFELANRASIPVTRVTTAFRQPILGPDGQTDLTKLRVFRRVEFMPPGKAIRVFVDTSHSYFKRRQPNLVHAAVEWRQGARWLNTQITHDLRIYADLPYIVREGNHPTPRTHTGG